MQIPHSECSRNAGLWQRVCPHLVLVGAGRGRLCDCSSARCWLASARREQTSHMNERLCFGAKVLCTHRDCAAALNTCKNAPGEEATGKRSLEDSLTSTSLQLAGQHFPNFIHPRGLNLRSWCLFPQKKRQEVSTQAPEKTHFGFTLRTSKDNLRSQRSESCV